MSNETEIEAPGLSTHSYFVHVSATAVQHGLAHLLFGYSARGWIVAWASQGCSQPLNSMRSCDQGRAPMQFPHQNLAAATLMAVRKMSAHVGSWSNFPKSTGISKPCIPPMCMRLHGSMDHRTARDHSRPFGCTSWNSSGALEPSLSMNRRATSTSTQLKAVGASEAEAWTFPQTDSTTSLVAPSLLCRAVQHMPWSSLATSDMATSLEWLMFCRNTRRLPKLGKHC